MTLYIILVSVVAFLAEWYIFRKTTVNIFIPIIVAFIIALPVGASLGLHLIAWPLLMMLLALALCEAEDRYLKRKGLSEAERSKLKDL